jgi:quercetin dioxygenase-like cupin family protein
MENKDVLTAGILKQSLEIQEKYPGLSRDIIETPVITLDYGDPYLNQQELEDYHESMGLLITHSDATSVGDSGSLQSHPRPDARRKLDGHLLKFDLYAEIENLKQEGNWLAGYQSAKTLVKSEDTRIVLIALHKDNEMKMHQSNGPISLLIMEGCIQFKTLQDDVELNSGELITLHKKVQHSVLAKEQSIILLTMDNTPAYPNERNKEDEEVENKEEDEQTIEESEHINFPDYPTYPPKDDAYNAPTEVDEKETPG